MKWCRHRKTKARGYNLAAPYDNVFIGCAPNDGMTRKAADRFDVYVNVSDSPCNTFEPSYPGQFMHWYPVNEMGRWNMGYLYWLKKVLDFHHAKKHKIYLHCHAGAYRSPSAALLWLQSRGITSSKARKIVGERSPAIYRIWAYHGNVPELKHEIFKSMKRHPTWALSGILFDACDRDYGSDHEIASGSMRYHHNLHKWFFFYFKPKWFLKERWSEFKNWAFDRYGFYSQGCGTYRYRRKYFWAWAKNAEPMAQDEDVVSGRKWSAKKRTFVKVRKK